MRKIVVFLTLAVFLASFALYAEDTATMPLGINTAGWEGSPTIRSDGQEIIFAYKAKDAVFATLDYNKEGPQRPASKGSDFDLYSTIRQENGSWSEPVNLSRLNTYRAETAPNFSPDGKSLLFVREENINKQVIYYSSRTSKGWSTPKPLPRPFNSDFGDTTPYQTLDGQSIFFASHRPKFNKSWQLWVFMKNEEGYFTRPNALSENPRVNDLQPAIDPLTNNLYFVSDRDKEMKSNIYVAHWTGNRWGKPLPMERDWPADLLTSPGFDSTGEYLYLGYYLKGKTGFIDICVSKRISGNTWGAPVPIEELAP